MGGTGRGRSQWIQGICCIISSMGLLVKSCANFLLLPPFPKDGGPEADAHSAGNVCDDHPKDRNNQGLALILLGGYHLPRTVVKVQQKEREQHQEYHDAKINENSDSGFHGQPS